MNFTCTPRTTTVNNIVIPLRRLMILFTGIIFFAVKGYGQIPVTVTNPGNATPALSASYTSLANALTALNATTAMSGPVILNLGAGTEPSVAAGRTIGSTSLNAALSATNTVTIVATTPGTAVLTAAVGTVTLSSTSATQDGILKLVGADYITIDGLHLVDNNASGAAMMEYGIALLKASATDGSNNNIIRNCNITLNRANNVTSDVDCGTGSRGILLANVTPSAMTTALSVTSVAGSNSNNQIYANTIQQVHNGILILGFNHTTAPYNFADVGNDVGGNSLTTGNTILNFGSTGTIEASAIRTLNQRNQNISYNSINSNNGGGADHPGALRGVYTATGTSTTNTNVTIVGNTITLKGSGTTAAITGIENSAGSSGAGNTVNISNNIIQNCTNTTATTGDIEGIMNTASADNLIINNNQVINNTIVGSSTANFFGIQHSTAVALNIQINNNTVSNNALTTTTSDLVLINGGGGTGTLNTTIQNNNVLNNTKNGASGEVFCIQMTGNGAVTVTGNTIDNNGHNNGSGSSTCNVYRIYNIGSSVGENYSNNTISNLFNNTTSSGTSLLLNIYINTVVGSNRTISGNTIFGSVLSSTASGTIAGIYNLTGNTVNIFKNKIYNLTGNGTLAKVHGIANATGTTINIYNNLIGNLFAPTASSSTVLTSYNLAAAAGVNGITNISGTDVNIYNNSVYLNANSTGAEFYTSALFSTVTSNLTVRNNIFVNLSGIGTSGIASGYRRSSTDMNSYMTASDNNLWHVGTTGANRVTFNGTDATYQALLDFKGFVTPREAASIRENPTFLSTTGSSANFLHIDASVATQIESGGQPITLVEDDFDGQPRNATTPDIGADEFDGIPAVVVNLSNVTINPAQSQCVATSRTVTAQTTAGSSPITSVSVFYRVNGGSLIEIPMTGGTLGAGSTSTWTATIPVPTPSNALIEWGVVAIDDATSKIENGVAYEDEQLAGATLLVSANPNPVCSGSTTELVATPIVSKSPVLINPADGTAATVEGPFYANNGNKHMQILYKSDELIAAGLKPGAISGMSFFITTIDAADKNEDFSVKMAQSTVTWDPLESTCRHASLSIL